MRKLFLTSLVFIVLMEGLQYITMGVLFAAMGVLFAAVWFMDLLLDYAPPQ